ncbi:MAG: peptidyl-prolyl cis-trans isomerase, partial [Planctomycetes bacterium]|nr:peptidyl-prolyl cis-trans isomerase [Planctomycetota bacterium]
MQRQLYPALLMITIALAAVVYMRPTVGEELMGLAGNWTGRQATGQETPSLPARSTLLGPGEARPSATQVAAAGSVPWPGTLTGQAFSGNRPPSGSPPSYPALSQRGYAYRPEFPQTEPEGDVPSNFPPTQESVAQAPGPSYPVAGQSREPSAYPPVSQEPGSRYPTAGDVGAGHPAASPPVAESAPGSAYPYRTLVQPEGPILQPEASLPRYRLPPEQQSSPQHPLPPGRQPPPQLQSPPRYSLPPRSEEEVRYPDPSARYSAPPLPDSFAPMGPSHGPQPVPPEAQFATGPPVIAEVRPCVGARILAVVGNEVILASEVMPEVERMIAGVPESELAKLSKRQLEVQRKILVARLLRGYVETKLIHQDALRTIPAEGLANIEERIAEHFNKKELPKMIEKAGVASRQELDEKLQLVGTSVERKKKAFINRTLAVQWMRQNNKLDSKVSHDQMLDYYHEHLAEFETPARARWETLTVRIPRYAEGSQARAKLAYLGDQVMRGVAMADALKTQPPGTPECRGGAKEWTTKAESGVSQTTVQALFGLPVGKLSQILRDGDEFRIIRVLQREPARRTPFEEAQVEIREKIQELDREKQLQAYLDRLKTQIPVWTVFDDDPD